MMRKGKFTARERGYLLSLPAVHDVRESRIFYSEEFKRDCMRRYHDGESPTQIFRDAGLFPELVGSKRIERCMARWREDVRRSNATSSSKDFDVTRARKQGFSLSFGKPTSGESPDYGGLILMRYENRLRVLEQKISEMNEQMGAMEERLRRLSGADPDTTQGTAVDGE